MVILGAGTQAVLVVHAVPVTHTVQAILAVHAVHAVHTSRERYIGSSGDRRKQSQVARP